MRYADFISEEHLAILAKSIVFIVSEYGDFDMKEKQYILESEGVYESIKEKLDMFMLDSLNKCIMYMPDDDFEENIYDLYCYNDLYSNTELICKNGECYCIGYQDDELNTIDICDENDKVLIVISQDVVDKYFNHIN